MSDQRTKSLGMIRLAFFMGVLLFAAVSIYLRTKGRIESDAQLANAGTLEAMRYVTWGLVLVAVIVASALRARLAGLSHERLSQHLLIGWALGEMAALTGGVQYYSGGTLSTMIIGIVGFAVVLLILRIPAPRPHTT